VVREVEIVVAGKRQQPPPAALDPQPIKPARRYEPTPKALRLQAGELGLGIAGKAVHRVPAKGEDGSWMAHRDPRR
jgi:hypothetical protein